MADQGIGGGFVSGTVDDGQKEPMRVSNGERVNFNNGKSHSWSVENRPSD
jgi:hypothetical protein